MQPPIDKETARVVMARLSERKYSEWRELVKTGPEFMEWPGKPGEMLEVSARLEDPGTESEVVAIMLGHSHSELSKGVLSPIYTVYVLPDGKIEL